MAERDTGLGKGTPDSVGLTDFDRKVYEALGKHPQFLHKDFLGYMDQRLLMNTPLIPIGQIVGFSQFTSQAAEVLAEQATASTAYTNLATVGPSLNGLPDGQYEIRFGAAAKISTAVTESARMSLEINGVAASDDDAALSNVDGVVSVSRVVLKTLAAGGNNTVVMKYRATGATATFAYRWLVALKIANA